MVKGALVHNNLLSFTSRLIEEPSISHASPLPDTRFGRVARRRGSSGPSGHRLDTPTVFWRVFQRTAQAQPELSSKTERGCVIQWTGGETELKVTSQIVCASISQEESNSVRRNGGRLGTVSEPRSRGFGDNKDLDDGKRKEVRLFSPLCCSLFCQKGCWG